MNYISFVYLFICVSFSLESSLVHHDRMSYLRGLSYTTNGGQDSYASDWRINVFPNYFDLVAQLPKEINHKYSSRRKQLSGSRNFDSSEAPIVMSKNAKSRDPSTFETLGLPGGNNEIRSQLLNSPLGLDAAEVSKKKKNVNTSMRAASTTEELLHNPIEAPDSSLSKEELLITHSTNTRSKFELLRLHRKKPHFSHSKDNTILLTIRPTIPVTSSSRTSESVPSSISTIFSDSDRIPEQNIHRFNKRAIASKANFCHSRHLHKCGEPVVQMFKLELDSAAKCKIREDFLDCMVRQRKEGCFSSDDSLYTDENTDMLRSKIKSHLWSAHGCLLF